VASTSHDAGFTCWDEIDAVLD